MKNFSREEFELEQIVKIYPEFVVNICDTDDDVAAVEDAVVAANFSTSAYSSSNFWYAA